MFAALIELEPQRYNDSVVVLVVVVLLASRLVVAVAVSVAWSPGAAVLWSADVAVRLGGVGLDFSVVSNCCTFSACCLGGVHVFLESGSSAPSFIVTSRISLSGGDAVRTCSVAHLITVAL